MGTKAKVGDTIKIIHLKGEDNRYDGKTGKVELIDGIGHPISCHKYCIGI